MIFYLGTSQVDWIWNVDVPIFMSRRRLIRARTMHPAKNRWALDSGGFSELSMYGEWKTSPELYAKQAYKWHSEIGGMDFAAIQDWMCEPFILNKTGFTVEEHQQKTIDSYKQLTDLKPEVPWIPIIQGFKKEEYLAHIDMYSKQGINLTEFSVVGIGSVCRRQNTDEAEEIIKEIHSYGIHLHGFGFKILGLRKVADYLHSADSQAWSYHSQFEPPLPGCTHKHCSNCSKYALKWREHLLETITN